MAALRQPRRRLRRHRRRDGLHPTRSSHGRRRHDHPRRRHRDEPRGQPRAHEHADRGRRTVRRRSTPPRRRSRGTARDGQALTVASDGAWTGTPPIGYTYQWQRCDAAGANCSDIGGATGVTHALTPADIGARMRAVVTATNAGGAASAPSVRDGRRRPRPARQHRPAGDLGRRPPTASRSARAAAPGPARRRSPTPTSGGAATPRAPTAPTSPGATGAGHTPTPADVGSTLRVVVTATNAGGSVAATSAQTATVAAAPPVDTGAAHPVRHGGRRADAQRHRRDVDRHADDHLRLPVAALRQQRRRLRRHPRARPAPRTPSRRPTWGSASASRSSRRTPAAACPRLRRRAPSSPPRHRRPSSRRRSPGPRTTASCSPAPTAPGAARPSSRTARAGSAVTPQAPTAPTSAARRAPATA